MLFSINTFPEMFTNSLNVVHLSLNIVALLFLWILQCINYSLFDCIVVIVHCLIVAY